MDEESRQVRLLILLAAVFCAVLIGYQAFYVPDAAFSWARESSAAPPPVSGEEYTPKPVPSTVASQNSSMSQQREKNYVRPGEKVNINTSTAAQLSDGLPGIGETLAGRIVEYRERNGCFQSGKELLNVSGIGEKKYEAIQNLVTTE